MRTSVEAAVAIAVASAAAAAAAQLLGLVVVEDREEGKKIDESCMLLA